MKLYVYKKNTNFVIDSFNIDEKTILVQKFLGENYIHAETTTRRPLIIGIGDYIKYNTIKYYINTLPQVVKNATNQYIYTITFESEYYNFSKVQYRSATGDGDFYLMNNLEGFLDLLVTNMNRVYSGWSKGTCTQSNQEYKLLRFEVKTCRDVIQTLCDEFKGEFSFNKKVISFSDEKTRDTGLSFEYKSGLRNIIRKPIESGNIITKLYAFGSTKNITTDYGSLRLKLNDGGNDYITSNTANYGTIEGSVIFDDIYPRRIGTVSSIASIYKFTDSSIDFDVNSYLMDGTSAKVNFLTGKCAGYTFEISSYNTSTKEFTIIPVQLEDDSEIPNVTIYPDTADTYVLVDIKMPPSYITAAEAELLTLAQATIAKYDHPRVAYELTPDWRYMQANNVILTIGDSITIQDTELNINTQVRITELTQQIIRPYKYTLSLTDQVEYLTSSTTEVILTAYKEATESLEKITASTVGDVSKNRRNWKDTQELKNMVFDPDGYYFSSSIKPLSIETTMLAAGSKSGNFELSGVLIQHNYLGDVNKLTISGGYLTHFSIDSSEADNIGTWTLTANTTYAAGGLTTGTAYYIYAKCNKTNYTDASNQIIVSSTAYQVDQTTYWYFLVGILHSTTGTVARGLSFSYGQTTVNGKFITTGKIQSADGNTYFDLDGNTLVVGSGSGIANFSDAGNLAVLDSVGASNCDTTIISDGKIITGLLTADNIQAGTLTGRVVQTDTGAKGHYQRIKLDSADNTMKFYNASNNIMVLIDDDANGYIVTGDTTNTKEWSQIRNGAIVLWSETANKYEMRGYYYDGTAWADCWGITANGDAYFGNGGVAGSGDVSATSLNVTATGYKVNSTKVVGEQGAAVADATGAGDVVAQLNTLLARCRAHGLIAT